MACYIPWYGKKRARLAEHERKFAELLRASANDWCLAAGAELVRAAHIRALKAMKAQMPPMEKNAATVAKLDFQIQFWLALAVSEIIEAYRIGKVKELRTAATQGVRNQL